MANLKEKEIWEDGIRQLETTDPVVGGEDGVDNIAPRQLANRTLWLKKRMLERMKISTLAEADAYKYIGQVESFEELRTIEPEKQGQRILVKSISAGKNLGGGGFYADLNDTTSEDDNRHTVITAGRHRWKRLVDFDLHTITPESDDISSDKTHSKFLAFSKSDVLDETGLAAGDYSGVQYTSVGRQVAQLLTRGHGLHYLRVNDLLSTEDGNVWLLEKLLTDVDMSHQIAGTSQSKVASEYALGKLNETLTQALNSIDLSDVTLSEKSKSQLKGEISSQVADDAYAKTQGFVQAEAKHLKENYIQIAQLVADSRVDNKGNSVLALTIEDDKSQIAMGITHNGNIYQPSAETKNSHFSGWAVTDSQDNVLLEFNTATAEFATADKKEGFTTARVFAQTDNEYQLSEQVLDSGEKYVPAGIISDVGICFLKDGDVHLQKGSVTIQVTQRGDVIACEMSGSAVRYVAPRRGLYLTYEWRDGETLQIFEPCDIDGYFLTGQSLAVSADNIATSTTDVSSDKAFTISTGPMWHKEWNDKLSGIIPLKERYYETVMSNFGKSVLSKKDKPIMVFGCARGGRAYSALIKGGESGVWEKMMTAFQFIQNTPFKTHYKAMLVIHGEQDGKEGNVNYDQNLSEWLNDYTAEIQSITGQKDKPVMLICQTAGAAYYRPNLADRHLFTVPFLQLKASAENPRIFAVTPKYMFNTVDGIHIDGQSADILGDYYGKVKHIVVDKGEDWLGVRPIKCQKVGTRTIEITFNVPDPPLVLDSARVTDPGNYGFYLHKSNGVVISRVALDDTHNKVVITTNENIPDGATITYAFDNGTGGKSGPTEGARGCLRDSCEDKSTDGTWTLHNWCFAFEEKIN